MQMVPLILADALFFALFLFLLSQDRRLCRLERARRQDRLDAAARLDRIEQEITESAYGIPADSGAARQALEAETRFCAGLADLLSYGTAPAGLTEPIAPETEAAR